MEAAAGAVETEAIPPLYRRWAEALLPGPIPRERAATCLDCAMAVPPEARHAQMGYFERSLKCCTYFPKVPNYLAGRAIDAGTPAAARMREFIEDGAAGRFDANVLGVFPVASYEAQYRVSTAQDFGRNPALLCPYAIDAEGPQGPMCGIWQHRNAVCSTYFCKHVRGNAGHTFWEAFRNLLIDIESSLAWWAAVEAIPEAGPLLGRLSVSHPHAFEMAAADRAHAWSLWRGSRADFYRACAERVEALSWDEALTIAGIRAQLRACEAAERFRRAYSSDVPARVRAAGYQVVQPGEHDTLLQAPRGTEVFRLPSRLLPLLAHFDGRPTEVILAEIAERKGVRIAPGLVRKLCDFGVLDALPPEGGA